MRTPYIKHSYKIENQRFFLAATRYQYIHLMYYSSAFEDNKTIYIFIEKNH